MDAAQELDFDAYVRASGPRLKRLAYLLTGDVHSAEDLLQSAYAKVLPRWRRVSTYEDPDAYLRKVMVNQRTSWWRRDRGRESLGPVPVTATAGDLADDQAELDVLLQALRALPTRQRTAVVLRHYCDLSEAETAAVMGITVGGVKSQTSKGLAALRAALVTRGTAGSQEEAAR
jgi:RNA polymerase sigma-70 factor (sigma-E family)